MATLPAIMQDGTTYKFQCSILYPDCEDVVTGSSEQETVEAARLHIAEHHGMIELPPEMTARVLASIDPSR